MFWLSHSLTLRKQLNSGAAVVVTFIMMGLVCVILAVMLRLPEE
jgi:hypothetical protein